MGELCLIVAKTDGGVIGSKGKMPWHLSEDLKRFKEITTGHPVIMGRKTYESLGRLLPGRKNIIITRNPSYRVEGALVVPSLEEAIKAAEGCPGKSGNDEKNEDEFFVIGGAEIYKLALPLAKRLYLTLIHHPFKGDVYFPEFELEKDFKILERSEHQSSGKETFRYTFITAERKAN
jgi:dihydrofolate reductase